MIVHRSVTQGSPEWLQLRLGIVTASEAGQLVTPLFKIKTGAGPETLLFQKLAEKATGAPVEDFGGNFAMEQGKLLEPEAIGLIELMRDIKVERVGFVTTDDLRAGCSPDGLLGAKSGLELKCPRPQTHIKYLMEGVAPLAYLPQIHWSMMVCEADEWEFLSYARGFPPLIVNVKRDEKIQDTLRAALALFNASFDAAWAKIETWPTSKHP